MVVLRPYFANLGRRQVKAPKIYFTDTGTLCHLVGLRDSVHAALGPMAGSIFEAAVLSEIMKTLTHRGESPSVYFWRTARGLEVDFVLETGEKITPVAAKLSSTPSPRMASGIKALRDGLGDRAGRGYVVHPGDVRLPLAPDIVAIPFSEM